MKRRCTSYILNEIMIKHIDGIFNTDWLHDDYTQYTQIGYS